MTNLFSFPHWVGLSFHINMTTCSNFTVKCMSVCSVPSSSDWFPICLRGNTNTYFICGMSFLQCVQTGGPPDTKVTSVRGRVLSWTLPCQHCVGDITGSPAYHPALCPGPSVPAQLTEAGLLGLSPALTLQVQAPHPDVPAKPCPHPAPQKLNQDSRLCILAADEGVCLGPHSGYRVP